MKSPKSTKEKDSDMSKKITLFYLAWLICSVPPLVAQSFYREKNAKTVFYQVGFGAGTFLAAPRPSYDSIVNQKLPVLSLGLGKRFGSRLTIKSTYTFQPYASQEYIATGEDSGTLEPMVSGFANALDIVPMVNLLPSFHHISRPIVDISMGAGLGYLSTYRTEKLIFNEKEYTFNLIENSFYIPIRASLSVKIGKVSDLVVEGAFFHTWLDDNREVTDFEKNSDHFAQLSFIYQRFIGKAGTF